ncbi:MAG: hypothetical protein WCW25_03210 [Patescibacteria group bacterium]
MFHFWRKCEECDRDEPHGCLFIREDGHEIFRICAGCDFRGVKCPSAQAPVTYDGVCVECEPLPEYRLRVLTKKKEPEAPSSGGVDVPFAEGHVKGDLLPRVCIPGRKEII